RGSETGPERSPPGESRAGWRLERNETSNGGSPSASRGRRRGRKRLSAEQSHLVSLPNAEGLYLLPEKGGTEKPDRDCESDTLNTRETGDRKGKKRGSSLGLCSLAGGLGHAGRDRQTLRPDSHLDRLDLLVAGSDQQLGHGVLDVLLNRPAQR